MAAPQSFYELYRRSRYCASYTISCSHTDKSAASAWLLRTPSMIWSAIVALNLNLPWRSSQTSIAASRRFWPRRLRLVCLSRYDLMFGFRWNGRLIMRRRVISIPIDSATRSGLSWSRMSLSRWKIPKQSSRTRSRLSAVTASVRARLRSSKP